MSYSTNEFYTGGKYLQNNPTWNSEDSEFKAEAINRIIARNKLQPVEVVEVGCGAGGNLVELSKLNAGIQILRGYDISPQAIALAAKHQNDKVHFYCEDYLSAPTAPASLLLMIDVVEHVEDYIGFLRKVKSKSIYFVFHIPLDLCCRTVLKPHVLLQQRQSVGHIHYFSKDSIEWALVDAGYEIIDQFYTKPAIDINPARSFKQFVKKTLRKISFAINPDRSAKLWGGYSIMFLLK
ncbi:MAG: class I SAM-dependent methyltransferase [Ferruginibacter sp.]